MLKSTHKIYIFWRNKKKLSFFLVEKVSYLKLHVYKNSIFFLYLHENIYVVAFCLNRYNEMS